MTHNTNSAELLSGTDPYNDLIPYWHIETDTPFARAPVPGMEEGPYTRHLISAEELAEVMSQAGPRQQRTLAIESAYLGIDPRKDPDGFVVAHQALINDVERKFGPMLADTKQRLVEGLHTVLGNPTISDGNSLDSLLRSRLEHVTRLRVDDTLVSTERARTYTSAAENDPGSKVIGVTTIDALRGFDAGDGEFEDGTVTHELLHSVFARSVVRSEDGSQWVFVRNGLQLVLPQSFEDDRLEIAGHAWWLNEALIESARLAMTTRQPATYPRQLFVLEVLDELSPGLRNELLLAAIDPEGPSAALGKVEVFLGPDGIERAGEYLQQLDAAQVVGNNISMDQLKKDVLGVFDLIKVFPSNRRDELSAAYDRAEKRLFSRH